MVSPTLVQSWCTKKQCAPFAVVRKLVVQLEVQCPCEEIDERVFIVPILCEGDGLDLDFFD